MDTKSDHEAKQLNLTILPLTEILLTVSKANPNKLSNHLMWMLISTSILQKVMKRRANFLPKRLPKPSIHLKVRRFIARSLNHLKASYPNLTIPVMLIL